MDTFSEKGIQILNLYMYIVNLCEIQTIKPSRIGKFDISISNNNVSESKPDAIRAVSRNVYHCM